MSGAGDVESRCQSVECITLDDVRPVERVVLAHGRYHVVAPCEDSLRSEWPRRRTVRRLRG